MPDDKLTIGKAVALDSTSVQPATRLVPTPANDVPGIRAELDALKATVAAIALRVAASEASAAKDGEAITDLMERLGTFQDGVAAAMLAEHAARVAQAAVLSDLCSTMCGFLTQPENVMDAMRDLDRRAKACRS